VDTLIAEESAFLDATNPAKDANTIPTRVKVENTAQSAEHAHLHDTSTVAQDASTDDPKVSL